MDDERMFSKTEIREKRRELSQLVALQQRQLAALAKMDEAADELDQVEREMDALTRTGNQPELPADADPLMTGLRALKILEDRAGIPHNVQSILDEWMKRGWSPDTEHERVLVLGRLRHSLARLTKSNQHVQRDMTENTYYYTYVESLDSDALIPIVKINGAAHPALQGGRSER